MDENGQDVWAGWRIVSMAGVAATVVLVGVALVANIISAGAKDAGLGTTYRHLVATLPGVTLAAVVVVVGRSIRRGIGAAAIAVVVAVMLLVMPLPPPKPHRGAMVVVADDGQDQLVHHAIAQLLLVGVCLGVVLAWGIARRRGWWFLLGLPVTYAVLFAVNRLIGPAQAMDASTFQIVWVREYLDHPIRSAWALALAPLLGCVVGAAVEVLAGRAPASTRSTSSEVTEP